MSNTELTPLTIERVRAFFNAQGWQYHDGSAQESVRTGFNGMGLEINRVAPNLFVTTSVAVEDVTADRYPEVLAWVERQNNTKAFPTATALKDEGRNLAALGVSYTIPGYWEHTDEQFAAHLTTGIESVLNTAREFLSEFAPAVLERLDADASAARGE